MTATATEAKSRWSPSEVKPGHPEQEKSQEKDQEKDQPEKPSGKAGEEGQGPTPRAGEPVVSRTTNYSVAPGFAWFEATNPAQISLAVGRVTTLVELPERGGGEYMTSLFREPSGKGQPIGLLILNPTTTFEGGGLENSGMSLDGFPGIPKSLPATTALPVNVGIHSVTINVPNRQASVFFEVRTAATIAAGKRWIFFTMTGV